MIPNADQQLREYQALQPRKMVYGARSYELVAGEAHDRCRKHCRQTTRGEHVCYVATWSWSQSAVSVSRASKRGKYDHICVSGVESKGRKLPLRADHNLYFLDALLPKLPIDYANVGETSSVMLWHRSLGHINAQSVKKLAGKKGAGMVVKDTDFSVSNCDTCAPVKSKQHNHPKVARIEVTQPLEVVYTDLSGPLSPASGAGNSYVAKFTDHHTRLKSVYFLSKKNEAIDA